MKTFGEYVVGKNDPKNEGIFSAIGKGIGWLGQQGAKVGDAARNSEMTKPFENAISALQNVAGIIQKDQRIVQFLQQSGDSNFQQLVPAIGNLSELLGAIKQKLPSWQTQNTLNAGTGDNKHMAVVGDQKNGNVAAQFAQRFGKTFPLPSQAAQTSAEPQLATGT
jgi:hypothetical protein